MKQPEAILKSTGEEVHVTGGRRHQMPNCAIILRQEAIDRSAINPKELQIKPLAQNKATIIALLKEALDEAEKFDEYTSNDFGTSPVELNGYGAGRMLEHLEGVFILISPHAKTNW